MVSGLKNKTRYNQDKKLTSPTSADRRLYRRVIYSRIVNDAADAYFGKIGNEKILDLGCGTGLVSRILKKKYPKSIVVGIDTDKRSLSAAKTAANRSEMNIKYVQGNSERLPFKKNMFDIVVIGLMMHHAEKSKRGQIMREVYRVMTKPGHLLMFETSETSGIVTVLRSAKFRDVKEVETHTHKIYVGEKC